MYVWFGLVRVGLRWDSGWDFGWDCARGIFPPERVLSRTPLIIRTVDQNPTGSKNNSLISKIFARIEWKDTSKNPQEVKTTPSRNDLDLVKGLKRLGQALHAPKLPRSAGIPDSLTTSTAARRVAFARFASLRSILLLMRWLLVLLLLLRPRGRTGARPMRASSPSVGANSIISSRRNVLLGCIECAVRALSEKVRGGCVHSL